MNKYKSCHLLEHGICFYPKNICSCCYAPYEADNLVPLIYSKDIYKGGNIEKDFLYEKINKWRNDAKNSRYIKSCEECYHLKLADWEQENYIDRVYITHFEKCNSNCIYCINNLDSGKRKDSTYKIVPVIDNMIEQGILKEGCEFHIGGGEFSIYPECGEIIEKYIISGFTKFIAIATNGIVFSDAIFKAINMNKACIIISVDSGSKKLYKRIKRVDAFNSLKKSLKMYTSTQRGKENTFLKYIVLPGINVSKWEFKKFLSLSKKYGINGIKLDIDGRYCRANNFTPEKKVTDFMKWCIGYAQKKGFNVETFQFYNLCLKNLS